MEHDSPTTVDLKLLRNSSVLSQLSRLYLDMGPRLRRNTRFTRAREKYTVCLFQGTQVAYGTLAVLSCANRVSINRSHLLMYLIVLIFLQCPFPTVW